MEVYSFIKETKPYHLTLGDVLSFSVGQKVDVVMWDRNFEEYWIWEFATPMKEYKPEVFFAENRWTITYKGNLEWTISKPNSETINERN